MVLEPLVGRFPRLELVWADGGYTGSLESWLHARLGWRLEIVQHPWQGWQGTWLPAGAPPPAPILKPKGFVVLKWRWVVERTFGWLGRSRRLSKDYEGLPETEESWVYACMTRLMVRRLARMAS